MKVREPRAFLGEAVEIWCFVTLRTKYTDVRVALVIGEDDDDIGRP